MCLCYPRILSVYNVMYAFTAVYTLVQEMYMVIAFPLHCLDNSLPKSKELLSLLFITMKIVIMREPRNYHC